MTFTVNVLFTCITYCDAGPGYDYNCLQVQQINSYLHSHVFLRRRRWFTSRKLYACLENCGRYRTRTMEELASSKYIKVCTSKRFTMFLKYFI